MSDVGTNLFERVKNLLNLVFFKLAMALHDVLLRWMDEICEGHR